MLYRGYYFAENKIIIIVITQVSALIKGLTLEEKKFISQMSNLDKKNRTLTEVDSMQETQS